MFVYDIYIYQYEQMYYNIIGDIVDRIVMHIDVNNAFLSWTAIDLLEKGYDEDIRNIYAIIGGDEEKRTGIVLAKSQPAKMCGVVTGEPIYRARKKCPYLKIFKSDYKLYQKKSRELFELISKYTPDIEVFSIDECFIEYTNVKKLYGNEVEFARKLSNEIKTRLGFTVNIGIGNNKLCAKMASDFSKPDKIHTLYSNEVEEKMYPLPVSELFGIGKKTSEKLNSIGIYTIGDLANANPQKLSKIFKNQAIKMIETARGIDNSKVDSSDYNPKGISNEITLDHNIIDENEVYHYLLLLSEMVGKRVRKQKKHAKVIAVIIKNKYFIRKTHQKTLDNPTNNTNEIYEISKKLYNEMHNTEPIRLIGLRLDGLTDKVEHQISLFDSVIEKEKQSRLDSVIDFLKDKYGNNVIGKASLKSEKYDTKKTD